MVTPDTLPPALAEFKGTCLAPGRCAGQCTPCREWLIASSAMAAALRWDHLPWTRSGDTEWCALTQSGGTCLTCTAIAALEQEAHDAPS